MRYRIAWCEISPKQTAFDDVQTRSCRNRGARISSQPTINTRINTGDSITKPITEKKISRKRLIVASNTIPRFCSDPRLYSQAGDQPSSFLVLEMIHLQIIQKPLSNVFFSEQPSTQLQQSRRYRKQSNRSLKCYSHPSQQLCRRQIVVVTDQKSLI